MYNNVTMISMIAAFYSNKEKNYYYVYSYSNLGAVQTLKW